MPTRRDMLRYTAALLGGGLVVPTDQIVRAAEERTPPRGGEDDDLRFKLGACDWSLGRRGRPEALARARKVGLDGVQVSFGPSPENMHLFERSTQQTYREWSDEYDVAIGGLALGALNQVPYKSSPRAERWVRDSIVVAQALDVEVVLLAFFGRGDIRGDRAAQDTVIERLKKVAPRAEDAGVVLGLETWLSAEEHLRVLEAVGSEHVQVYYDVANSLKQGYDIYDEIRRLGRDRICEVHAKENGALLGEGRVDFGRVREALDDIGYRGWIQIEGAVPSRGEVVESYVANVAFLRSLLYASD